MLAPLAVDSRAVSQQAFLKLRVGHAWGERCEHGGARGEFALDGVEPVELEGDRIAGLPRLGGEAGQCFLIAPDNLLRGVAGLAGFGPFQVEPAGCLLHLVAKFSILGLVDFLQQHRLGGIVGALGAEAAAQRHQQFQTIGGFSGGEGPAGCLQFFQGGPLLTLPGQRRGPGDQRPGAPIRHPFPLGLVLCPGQGPVVERGQL